MAARRGARVLLLAACMSRADSATRVVELENDSTCSRTNPSQRLSLRCAVTGANTGDVVEVTSSIVYTLTLADRSCSTNLMAAAALQVCRTHHLTIRSSTPKARATIRVDLDQDDGSAHRVLWVGEGASLTLVDIMLTGGRSLMRGGGVKLDTDATGVFVRAHFAANEALQGGALYLADRARATLADSVGLAASVLPRWRSIGFSRRLGSGTHRKLSDRKRRSHRGGRGRRRVVAALEPLCARFEQASA